MLSKDKIVVKEAVADKKAKKIKKDENVLETLGSELANEEDRIGNLLCHERLKKGLELEDISQVLCIRQMYLEAIENGNYVELPPLPYSAGFVNSYAKYLGLNNTRITQLFREELNDKPKEKRVFLAEEAATEASLPHKRYVIGGMVALALIGSLWSFGYKQEADVSEEVDIEATEPLAGEVEYFSPAAEEPEAVVPVENVSEPVKENKETADQMKTEETVAVKDETPAEDVVEEVESKPISRVEIKITRDDTWVEIRDKNKVYFNKVMRPGESYEVPAGAGMILSVGKYKGVDVYIDGKLTPVIDPNKKMGIPLDPFLKAAEH